MSGVAYVGASTGDESRFPTGSEQREARHGGEGVQSGFPVSAAAAVLARLELKGVAVRHPGGRFARAVAI